MRNYTRLIYWVACFLLSLTFPAKGQYISGYTFSQSYGSYTPISSGTTHASGSIYTGDGFGDSLPFSFQFDGTSYSSISISANGYVSFGGGGGTGLPISSSGTYRAIAAFGIDLSGSAPACAIKSDVVGIAPNRTYIVEWRSMSIWGYSGTSLSCQVRLQETTNIIEIVYGNTYNTIVNANGEVGLRGINNTQFNNRYGYSSWTSTSAGTSASDKVRWTPSSAPTVGLTFRWTPPPGCTAPSLQPTGLYLSSAGTSVTGNFTAAPGANGYLVVKSFGTLSGTPVNGTTYTTGSSLGSGTVVGTYAGTSFTSSGLSPLTNYTFTVFSYYNVGCPGVGYNTVLPLTGTVLTAGPRKYQWIASGTGDYTVATNWSPARVFTDIHDTLLFNGGGTVNVTNVPMQSMDVLSVSGGTNVKMTSSTNDSLKLYKRLDVTAGSVLTLAGTNTLKIYFPAGSGATASIDGTLNLGGNSIYSATNAVTTVNGTVTDSGANAMLTTNCNCATSLIFNGGSVYNHARNGGIVPQATFAATSTINITGITTSSPTFYTTQFGDLVWNCPAQTQKAYLENVTTVQRDFKLISTGTDTLINGYNDMVIVGRDFIQNGGVYCLADYYYGSLKVLGNISLNGGTIDMNGYPAEITPQTNLFVYGNLTQNIGHSFIKTGPTPSGISFCGNTHQNITVNGSMTNTRIGYILDNAAGATLTGSLAVGNGATNTIKHGMWDGTGHFGYDATGDSLVYASNDALLATAIEWPVLNPPANVVLRLTGTGAANQLAIPGARTAINSVTCQNGILVLNNYDLTTTYIGGSYFLNDTNRMIVTDSTGRLILSVASSTSPITRIWQIGTLKNGKASAKVTMTFASNSIPRNIGVRCIHHKHPNEMSATNYMNLYWPVTDDGGTAPFVLSNLGMNFFANEIVGAPEMRINGWNGSLWTEQAGSNTPTSMTASGITYMDGINFTGRPTQHTVYTWTGAISKDYAVAGNWTPARTTRRNTDFLLFNSGNTDSVKNVIPNDTVAQVKVTNNTAIIWQTASSTGYYNIKNLDSTSGGFIVDSGSYFLSLATTYSFRMAFGNSSTGATFNTIGGTVELQATSSAITNNINFANSITTITGSGRLAVGSASASTSVNCTPSNLYINGTYEHKFTTIGGYIPDATWGAGSLCLINSFTTNGNPSIGTAPIRKLIFNCPALTGVAGLYNLPQVTDSFIVISTGSSTLRLSSSVYTPYRFNHFRQTGGSVDLYAQQVNIAGSFVQSGGTMLNSYTSAGATLNFNGSAIQDASFNNSAPVGGVVYRVSNPNGINLTGTGTLTSTFAINSGGGVRISVPVTNPISTSLALVYDSLNSTLTFDTATSAPATAYVADATVFPAVNGPANLTVNVGDSSTMQLPFSRTIPRILTMQSGDVLINANTLTIGTSPTSVGTLNWTKGYVVPTTGALSRWYGTSGLPTSPGTSVGYYPLKYGNAIRSTSVYFNTSISLTSAGYITVSSGSATGFTTGLSVADGTETMTVRTNSAWLFNVGGGISLAGSIGTQVTAGGLFSAVVDPTRLHLMKSGSVVGIHTAGSGTASNFKAARMGLSLTDLTTGAFYVGAQDSLVSTPGVYISVANGNWNTPSTWNVGTVPPSGATVYVANGKTVLVSSSSSTAAKLTVYPGSTLITGNGGTLTVDTSITNSGTFNVSGGTVSLGPAGGGKCPFTGTGILKVDSGALKINGYLRMNRGSTLNQTGGDIIIDGNASGVAANSASTSLLQFDTCTIEASAGTITLIDPRATGGYSLYANLGTWGGGLGSGFTGTHTLIFGDGVSITSGPSTGFSVFCALRVNNVVVKGSPTGSGSRQLQFANTLIVNGDLSLTGNNAKLDLNGHQLSIGGNLAVDAGATAYMSGRLYLFNPTQPQAIGGLGSYYNATSSPTANFSDITMDNGSAEGVTINLTDPAFANSLIFYNGTLRAASGALVNKGLTVNTASQSTGWVSGKYRKAIPTSGGTVTYPIGDSLYYAGVTLSVPGAFTTGAITISTTAADHPAIGSSSISPWRSVNRYYTVDTSGGLQLSAYGASLAMEWNPTDQDSTINWSTFGAASYRGGTWRTENITVNTPTNISVVNLGNDIAGSYQLGARTTTPFLTSQPVNQAACNNTNPTFSVGAGAGSTYQWQVNNGTGWVNATNGTSYTGVTTATLTVASVPLSFTGYSYRCKVTTGADSLFSAAATLTVSSMSSPVTAPSTPVCTGLTSTLTCAAPGGTWSNGGALSCTIGSATGIVTGVFAGTAVISYTLPTGCRATAIVTVATHPSPITGTPVVCVNAVTTLNSTPAGGIWISDVAAIATVNVSTGAVTGVTAGTATISYIVSSAACAATTTVTVNPLPAPVTGTFSVCANLTTTLSSITTGGTWTSSAGSTVGSASGIVTGLTPGTSVISYTANGCSRSGTVTVSPSPAALTGVAPVCVGATVTFASTTTGGTWTSAASAIATVSTSGAVTGVSAGSVAITYTSPSNGCYALGLATVNALPDPVTGAAAVCMGSSTTLSSPTSGGTWTSSAPAIASIGSTSAIVIPIVPGTANITYTLPTGCYRVRNVTANAIPAAIAGTLAVCEGASSTLTNSTMGGTWTSSDTWTASVGATNGVGTGISPGTVIITYTLPNGCYDTALYTVKVLPAPVTGTANVCTGSTTTLYSGPAGGSWHSASPAIATVVASSGLVTGVSAGTTAVSYTISNGCSLYIITTVNPVPTITGTMAICSGTSTTLTGSVAGGVWTSGTPPVAIIGAASGIVSTSTGSGTSTITYALPTGCRNTAILTVNALPSVITGPSAVCIGANITLSSASGSGTWVSTTPSVAAVSLTTGIITGASAGTATITFTLPTGCSTTRSVSVDAVPVFTVSGPDYICIGKQGSLTSSTTSGTWSSSNTAVATVSASGQLTPLAGGTTLVSYTVTNSCGPYSSSKTVIVYTRDQCDSVLLINDITSLTTTMELFPNPNNGTFSVMVHTAVPETLYMNIHNQLGQTLWEGNTESNLPFTISADIPPGIYTLSAHGSSGVYTSKFVKGGQ